MSRFGPVWRFTRHYLEMVAAMMLGMLLHPVWRGYTDDREPGSVLRSVEVDSLAMATAMAVPMVLWMAIRRHDRRATAEMAAAMYVAFLVLFPLGWAGVLGDTGILVWGHVVMFVLMLLVMLWHRHEFTHHSHGRKPTGERRTIEAAS
jgi:flagellar biosynthetic protein FliP